MNFITLRLDTGSNDGIVDLEMPAVTTGYRAAQRAADALGGDPEGADRVWVLARVSDNEILDFDEPVADYDGVEVMLLSIARTDLEGA